MTLRTIDLGDIRLGEHIRPPRRRRIDVIKAAMQRDGLRTPIEVAPAGVKTGFILTTGRVRLAAARELGWPSILCEVRRCTTADRRKRDIDDNLLQDGNTVLDRARFHAAAKSLYEEEFPETRHGGVRRKDQVAKVGDLKPYFGWAADRYAISERTVQRLCTIGRALAVPVADQIADTEHADNQSGLEQLSRLTPDQQAAVAALLVREPDPVEAIADAIEKVVGRAPETPVLKRWSAAYSNYTAMGARERRGWLQQLVEDDLLPEGVSISFGEQR